LHKTGINLICTIFYQSCITTSISEERAI